MSIGNIIGSNILDGLIPIVLRGLISTANIEIDLLRYDSPILFGVTLLVLLMLKTQRGERIEGAILYLSTMIYLFIKFTYFGDVE